MGETGNDDARAVEETHRFLARLATAPKPGARDRLPGAGAETVEALLDVIDETVMARQLRLANAEGARLTLDVCNRRLLRMQGGSSALADLGFAGGSDLSALLQQLHGFAAPGGVVMQRAPSDSAARLGDSGIAAATLRQAWARARAPASLHDLCAPLLPLCRSWLCHDPEADSTAGGEEDEIDRLVAVLERIDPGSIGERDPAAILLDNGAEALLLLRRGDGLAAFLLPATAGFAALQALDLSGLPPIGGRRPAPAQADVGKLHPLA